MQPTTATTASNSSATAYYFAYGSNMSASQMADRMHQGGGRCWDRAWARLDGYRLAFNKRSSYSGEGYANVVPEEGASVEGVLYGIDRAGLLALDRFEGVPNNYVREVVHVTLADGQQLDAIVYVAVSSATAEGLKPSREYLNRMLKGRDLLNADYAAALAAAEVAPERPREQVAPRSPHSGNGGTSWRPVSTPAWRQRRFDTDGESDVAERVEELEATLADLLERFAEFEGLAERVEELEQAVAIMQDENESLRAALELSGITVE